MGAALLKLALATAAIYLACEYFTNAVEWLGRRLKLSQTATGTLLAAFGTALPESVVTLMASAFGTSPGHWDIGIGAALGGPLALSTIGYGVIACGALMLRGRRPINGHVMGGDFAWLVRDQIWFLSLFAAATILGLIELDGKFLFGFLFLLSYALYLCLGLDSGDDHPGPEQIGPLAICPKATEPRLVWIGLQLALSLAVIFFACRAFVEQLESMGAWLGLSSQLTALLLSPIATEMPETINSILWVRQGKTNLALGNISGAMMIQATIPAAFGLFFTPWIFEESILLAPVVTIMATTLSLTFLNSRRAAAKAT